MGDLPSAGFKQLHIIKKQDGVIRILIKGRDTLEVPEVCIEKCNTGGGFTLVFHEIKKIRSGFVPVQIVFNGCFLNFEGNVG